MKISILLCILSVFTFEVNAQYIPSLKYENSPEITCCMYSDHLSNSAESQKSVGVAVFLEWLVPTVGHAYAGNWKRGLLPNAVRVSGAVLFAVGLSEGSSGDLYTGETEMGLIMMAGGTIWAMVRAGRTAKEYNDGLRLDVGVREEGVSLGLTFSF